MQLIEKDCGEICPICGGYSKYYGYDKDNNNIYLYHICNKCDRDFKTVYKYYITQVYIPEEEQQ